MSRPSVVPCAMRNANTGWPISWQTWTGLTLIWDVPPSCPAAQPVLPISHQPRQSKAEGGTAKIKVNPTQIRQEMGHPVYWKPFIKPPHIKLIRLWSWLFQELRLWRFPKSVTPNHSDSFRRSHNSRNQLFSHYQIKGEVAWNVNEVAWNITLIMWNMC